jgi:hypothetical protein
MVKLIGYSCEGEFDEIIIKPTPKTFELYDPVETPSYTSKEFDGFLRTKVKNKEKNHKAWSYIGHVFLNYEYVCIWGYTSGSITMAHPHQYRINQTNYSVYADLLFGGFMKLDDTQSPLLKNIKDITVENVKQILSLITVDVVIQKAIEVVVPPPPATKTKKVTILASTPTTVLDKKKKSVCEEEEEDEEGSDFSDNESDHLSELMEDEILPEEEEEEEEEEGEVMCESDEEEEGLAKDETELQMEEYDYPDGILSQQKKTLNDLTNLQNFYYL